MKTSQLNNKNLNTQYLNGFKHLNQANKQDLLNSIKGKNSNKILKIALPLLKKSDELSHIRRVIHSVKNIGTNREKTINLITKLVTNNPNINKKSRTTILSHFLFESAKIKVNEREEVIKATAHLLNEKLEPYQITEIFLSIKKIKTGHREELAKAAKPLINRVSTLSTHKIFRCLEKIKTGQREKISKIAKSFFLEDLDPDSISSLLPLLGNLKEKNRNSIVKISHSLVKGCLKSYSYYKYLLIQQVAKLKDKERETIIKEATPFLNKTTDILAKTNILASIQKLKKNDKKIILTLAQSLVKKIAKPINASPLIDTIEKMHKNKREAIVKASMPFIKKETNGSVISQIITSINKLKENNRDKILEISQSILNKITKPINKAVLIDTIAGIHKNKREAIANAIIPFLNENTSETVLIQIIKSTNTLKENDRDSILKISQSLLNKITKPINISPLIDIITGIQKEEREEVIKIASPLLVTAKDDEVIQILLCFLSLPKENHQKVFDYLNKTAEKERNIQTMLQKEQELRDCCYAFLQNRLEDETDINAIKFLSALILDRNGATFLLSDEDPLFLCATHYKIHSNSETAKSIFNPYTVFNTHLNLQKENKKVTIKLKKETFFNKTITTTTNRKHFLKKAQEQEAVVLVKELPKVTWEEFKNMMINFKERIKNLPLEQQNKLDEEYEQGIANNYGLINNFLTDPYLQRLIQNVSKNANDPVSQNIAKFFSIVNYILSQPNTLIKGELLSKQEFVFLAISNSIQNCRGGKSESIQLAYNLLPNKNKIEAQQTNKALNNQPFITPEQKTVEAFIEKAITKEIENLFNSPKSPFLLNPNVIRENESLNQLAHQSIYLRNAIGNLVGLNHKIQFDSHTFCIDSKLIRINRALLLKEFYNCFTAKFLMKKIQEKINQKLSKKDSSGNLKNKFYNHLKEFITQSNLTIKNGNQPAFMEFFSSEGFLAMKPIGKNPLSFGKDGNVLQEGKEEKIENKEEGEVNYTEGDLIEKYQDDVYFINVDGIPEITRKGALMILVETKYLSI